MRPQNLVFIFSDQHDPSYMGVSGNPIIKTPNLDKLAGKGTRFTSASTPCPICVPARASLATGTWVHQNRSWDNAIPYTGAIPSWGHRLIERGHEVAAIGKLHYRSDDDDNGFSEKIETMNVVDGVGDRIGWLRRKRFERGAAKNYAGDAGRGDSSYTEYDRRIAEEAQKWLRKRASQKASDKPWVLYLGFVMPHLPLIAPNEFYDMYAGMDLPEPRLYRPEERPKHPWLEGLIHSINYDKYFDAERRRVAITAYHGMVSYLDHNIGLLLKELEDTGLASSTRVLYSSDHGEVLGNHGIWGKCCMYQESVNVPMILAGEGVPVATTEGTETSLVDAYPTILDAVGVELEPEERRRLPGRSLFDLAVTSDPARYGFSEYHAVGAVSGAFMIRRGRWKYVHYVGLPPQLFDLATDPIEARDLGQDPAHAEVRGRMEAALRRLVDPEAASALAFADQDALIEKHGGADQVLAVGDFGHTPTPYEKPHFEKSLEG